MLQLLEMNFKVNFQELAKKLKDIFLIQKQKQKIYRNKSRV